MEVTGTGKISPDDIKNSVDIIKNIDTAIEVRETKVCDYTVYSVINLLRGTCVKVKITKEGNE
jgi:hypothetical protein